MINTHTSPKYAAAKIALGYARDLSVTSKRNLEDAIAEMEKASSMPVEVLKKHIWGIYNEKEPERVQNYIRTALKWARGNSSMDDYLMESWLKSAQEHSEVPLAQSVIDSIRQEYQRHEPQRKYEALQSALGHPIGNSIADKDSREYWLKAAKKHSHGVKDKIVTHLAGLSIKAIHALSPVSRR
ncbi:MAG: hypothetical protein V1702_05085 [Candidatus Woesearchaeota archaeon]